MTGLAAAYMGHWWQQVTVTTCQEIDTVLIYSDINDSLCSSLSETPMAAGNNQGLRDTTVRRYEV